MTAFLLIKAKNKHQ